MSEAAIRQKIAQILAAVTGVEVVHQYRRMSRSPAKILQFYRDSEGKVNAWQVYRTKAPADNSSASHVTRHHHFKLEGIRWVDDAAASELAAQALADAVFAAFVKDPTLSGTCNNTNPLQLDDIGYDQVGDEADKTIYHFIECTLVCHERTSTL